MGDEIVDSSGQDVPILQAFCQTGEYYREKGDLEKAEAQLREALRLQSNHLAARLMLASIFVDNERLDEGLQELEEACRIDEEAVRTPMVRALLKKGDNLDQAGKNEGALHTYERVLQLAPGDEAARQRISLIWKSRAEEALQAEDLELAISVYEHASLPDEVAKVKRERRRRTIEQAAAGAKMQEQREDWQEACASYEWLIDEDPQNESWPQALERAELEAKLQDRYANATGALQRSEWASAIDLLIEVLTVRPDYKDSASRLAEAVSNSRKAEQESDAASQDLDTAESRDAAITTRKEGQTDTETSGIDPARRVAQDDSNQRVRSEYDAIEQGLHEARKCMEDGHFSKALALCDKFLGEYPDHALFEALKLDTQDRERQALSAYIAEIDRKITQEPDLGKRASILKEALRKFPEEPHFSKALRDIQHRRDLVASIVSKARFNEESGRFEQALEQWETVRSVQADYPGLEFEHERLVRRLDQQVANETGTPPTFQTDTSEQDHGGASPLTPSAQPEQKSVGKQVTNGSALVVPHETGQSGTKSGALEEGQSPRSQTAPPQRLDHATKGLTAGVQSLPRRPRTMGRRLATAIAKRPFWFFAGAATFAAALAVFIWMSKPSEKPVLAPLPLSLSTVPSGAQLTVDGQTCVTPCQISLASGSYQFEASLDGYYPLKGSIHTESPPTEALALKPMPTLFRIETDLDSGTVKVDDVVAGELMGGGFQTEFDEPGEHIISLLGRDSSATIVIRTAYGRAPQLVSPIEGREFPAALVAGFGEVGYVYGSEGVKATVTLDGDRVGELDSGPLELPSLDKGSHDLLFSEGTLAGAVLLNVGPEPAATLFLPSSISSNQEYGTLEVLAREANGNFIQGGAVVIAGGTYRKPRKEDLRNGRRAPYLLPGTYEVHVVGEGYNPSPPKEIEIRKGVYRRLDFILEPQIGFAVLALSGLPSGAEVLVDRQSVGKSDRSGSLQKRIPAGNHRIELRGFRRIFDSTPVVRDFPAGEAPIRLTQDDLLKAARGELVISVKPSTAKLTLRKSGEGKQRKIASGKLFEPSGDYIVRASALGYHDFEIGKRVSAGDSVAFKLDLVPRNSGRSNAGTRLKLTDLTTQTPGWTEENGWHVRNGGEFALLPTPSYGGIWTFTANPQKGSLRWVLHYRNEKNYVLFELESGTLNRKKSLYRTEVVGGEKRPRKRVAKDISGSKIYTIKVTVMPTQIDHEILLGKEHAPHTSVPWDVPGANFATGQFGF